MRILILRGVSLFNPDAPSGIRTLSFAKSWANAGHLVTVCQPVDSNEVKKVEELGLPSNVSMLLMPVAPVFWRNCTRVDVHIPFGHRFWQVQCRIRNWMFLRYLKRQLKFGVYNCIVVSVPDVGLCVVAKKLADAMGIPWVVDFRDIPDELDPDWKCFGTKSKVKKTSGYIKTAEFAVTVSPPLQDALKSRYGARDVRLIPNGYDGELSDPVQMIGRKTQKFSILYAGSIKAGRSGAMRVLFEGLDVLKRRGVDMSCVEVVHVGYGGKLIYRDCCGCESLSAYRFMGPKPRNWVLELERRSNLLLCVGTPSCPGILTSKIFEFAMAGVPVLNVPSESDIVAEFVRRSGIGVSCASPERVADVLFDRISRWKDSGGVQELTAPDVEYLRGFSRKKLSLDFLGYIQDMLKKKGKDRYAI